MYGLDLSQYSEEQQQKIAERIFEQLEGRLGDKIAPTVSDEKFAEFENLIDKGEDNLDDWLDKNVPNYEQMVEEILGQLKKEVAANPQAFLNSES